MPKEKLHLARLGGEDDDRTHQEYVDCFMNLLEFLIKNSRQGNLTFQHVSTLYENFVLCGVTEYEEQQFFLFIAKENESSATRERRYLLNDKIRIEVFKNIMCNGQLLDSANICHEGFKCFRMMFITVNNAHKLIDFENNGNYVVNSLQTLIGMDTLWEIVINCKDDLVLQESQKFLVDLHV